MCTATTSSDENNAGEAMMEKPLGASDAELRSAYAFAALTAAKTSRFSGSRQPRPKP
jgi:hypothetical protein